MRAEERRQAILHALERLLQEHDLRDLTVQGIAAAAGVGRSTFYTYFPTREAAVTELGSTRFELMAHSIELMGDHPGPHGVERAMRSAIEDWLQHERIMLAMLDARGFDPEAASAWDQRVDLFRRRVALLLRRQREHGDAPPGPDPELLVAVLMAANDGIFERLSRGGLSRPEQLELGDALIATWLRSIYLTDLAERPVRTGRLDTRQES